MKANLEELDALERAATPGPWGPDHGNIKGADARLIAKLRTAAPELITTTKAARELAAAVRLHSLTCGTCSACTALAAYDTTTQDGTP